jgi:hypothetical protein
VITEESPTDEPKRASREGATSSVDNSCKETCKERRRRTSLFSGTDESGWDDSG